jgi:Transposase zinc-ribbon domain
MIAAVREEALKADSVRDVLASIATVGEMTAAFQDEDHCRRLLEALVWPRGRICPACGYRCSTALARRDVGRSRIYCGNVLIRATQSRISVIEISVPSAAILVTQPMSYYASIGESHFVTIQR